MEPPTGIQPPSSPFNARHRVGVKGPAIERRALRRHPINCPCRLTAAPPLLPPESVASVVIQARPVGPVAKLKPLTTPVV